MYSALIMFHHVILMSSVPKDVFSGDKFVDSELARKAENASIVSRPSLLVT